MKQFIYTLLIGLVGVISLGFLSCQDKGAAQNKSQTEGGGFGLTPIPFNEVTLEDQFWKPRLKTQVETLVPFSLDKTVEAQKALKLAGDFLEGLDSPLPKPHRYQSSDLFKVMEGAAYLLKNEKNPALEKRMDSIIDIIARAQQKDGYLYVPHVTGTADNPKIYGEKPYKYVLHSHELYNMGHMYEGAIAYYQATGKDKWLKVAEKNAQHINKVFFEGDPNYNDGVPVNQAPGHQELELALAKLYRLTENPLYLEMAKKFLDIRGKSYQTKGEGVYASDYAQQHLPVQEQRTAVGHAVRATYLYSGMADVGALSGTNEYNKALKSIWHDIVDRKMSITGGLGAVHGIEGFGPEYVLPNKEAYNETCAAVGNVFFNFRMFLLTKDSRYMDVAEVSLLNNALAGVNIEGNRFFYVNPLEADGETPFNHGRPGRSPWFGTACCPSNIARLIPQVSGMMYATDANTIYANYYASSSTTIPLEVGNIDVKQKSNYPFEGKVDLELKLDGRKEFEIRFRIPTWARTNQFVPGELYHYTNSNDKEWSVSVNGDQISAPLENGFAVVRGKWKTGDKLSLDLPMPVRFNQSIDQVEANNGRLAVTRGPLVFAAEEVDNTSAAQHYYFDNVPQGNQISEEPINSGILKNVVKISVPSKMIAQNGSIDEGLKMIPYYAWDNRGDESMIVWVPTSEQGVQFSDGTTARGGKYKSVETSSTGNSGSLTAISDPRRPSSSIDRTIQPWISKDDQAQWVNVHLDKIRKIRSVNIYWFDDGRGVSVPASWSVQYQENNTWKDMPLYVTDDYSLDKDEYNVVHPAQDVVTAGIRVKMNPEKGKNVGVLDLEIDFDD
ncbi:MAG: glycoside hydrolase family 127 protein [Flavobacteriaceae bacterium]|nr:glycoside hydrolase family 127 protein [Flavobacteriaceae bacterium]